MKVPASIPIGAPMKTPKTVSIRLPTMALARPPALPGGGVISVKMASDRPPTPFQRSVAKTITSHAAPKAVAATDRPMVTALVRRRRP
jgi:hypothetical protein